MEHYNQELEHNLLEMVEQKAQADKHLLTMEIVLGIMSILPLLAAVIVALTVPMSEAAATVMVIASLIPLLIATPFAIKIEQKAGYYECAKCGHRYVPAYKPVFMAMHLSRTRYMKCPKCGRRSWQKKVLHKE